MRSLEEIQRANGETPASARRYEVETAWGGGSSVLIPEKRMVYELANLLKDAEVLANDEVRRAFMQTSSTTSTEYQSALSVWAKIIDARTAISHWINSLPLRGFGW